MRTSMAALLATCVSVTAAGAARLHQPKREVLAGSFCLTSTQRSGRRR